MIKVLMKSMQKQQLLKNAISKLYSVKRYKEYPPLFVNYLHFQKRQVFTGFYLIITLRLSKSMIPSRFILLSS